jgi:hypothetical protein
MHVYVSTALPFCARTARDGVFIELIVAIKDTTKRIYRRYGTDKLEAID